MSSEPPRLLLAELEVASLLIYPSRPQSAADREAREVILTGIKQAKPRHLQRVAERLATLPESDPVRRLVPSQAVLVPAPRSFPLAKDSLWPALQIAEALRVAGVGLQVLPLLSRSEPVRRSTGARAGADREPPLRHFETIEPTSFTHIALAEPRVHFVIVDDVVTTGSTLIACASRLAALAPEATITAFAVARAERTQTLGEAQEMFSPTVQTITLDKDEQRPWRG